MNPPAEDWIEYNQSKFEKTMKNIDTVEVNIMGKKYKILISPYLRQCNLEEAAGFLKTEIYFRQVQLLEKHCT